MSFLTLIEEIWDNQALTAAEKSHTNGNILDLELPNNIPALVDNALGFVYLNIIVGTSAGGMASGAHFDLLSSDSATFASGNRVLAAIGTDDDPLSAADLAAGERFSVQVPHRILHKYVGLSWNVVNESASALKVDAWFGMAPVQAVKTQKEPT